MPTPLRPAHRRTRCVAALCLAATLGACGRAGGDAPRSGDARAGSQGGATPTVELLLAAGDSTYWIATTPAGVRVRGAPLLLAHFDGRLHEVYAADDDRSFPEALFTAQRVYRRDLERGDSVVVFDDARVYALAQRWADAHPDDRPLEPDEEPEEDPVVDASSEVVLLDVHGAYLSMEHRLDVETRGPDHRHALRRLVIDLRSGRPAALADLFGRPAADALTAEGRRRLARAVDSLRALAPTEGGAAAPKAVRALRTVRLDPASFGLVAADGAPAVAFTAIGADDDGAAVSLPLTPIPAPTPAWWTRDVAPGLPRWTRDSSEARWSVAGAELAARPAGGTVRLALRTAGATSPDRPLGAVAAPVHQLLPIDPARLGGAARRALRRAFDEGAFYGETTTSVAWRH